MNQDFALLATPAIARRLLLLSRVSPMKLPDSIAILATQDQIGENDFDPFVCQYTDERACVTQFLLDSQMRGIVQAVYHPTIDEVTLLNVTRLTQPNSVTIITSRRGKWRRAANAYTLPNLLITAPQDLTGKVIDARRDGILIFDLSGDGRLNSVMLSECFVREFPRVILYDANEQASHWTVLASLLFPLMPKPTALHQTVLSTLQLVDLAVFYNVCIFPEYIKSNRLLKMAGTASSGSANIQIFSI